MTYSTPAIHILALLICAGTLLQESECAGDASRSLRGLRESSSSSTCSSDTGGNCTFVGCYLKRGPTTCVKTGWITKRCMCKPGYCAVDGVCRLSVESVKADVASVTVSNPSFPSPHGDISTAVCISGGGSRSLTLAMGQLRALEKLGLMKDVDAISAVSGGSWATSVYMFASESLETLLGASAAPSSLTMDVLKQTPPALGNTIVQSNVFTVAGKLWLQGESLHKLWQQSIAQMILSPFGLADRESFMAADADAAKRIVNDNPDLAKYKFLTPTSGRPKVFIMGGTMLAPDGESVGDNGVTFQMSPDYIGSPFHPDGKPLSYDSSKDVIVGGGLVESFAFGGTQPAPQSGGAKTSMPAPKLPFTLADAVGISSAAFAGTLSRLSSAKVAELNPEVEYWPVTKETQASIMFEVGDGGSLENTGVLEVLQRGARKIVWFTNTETDLVERSSFDFCSVTDPETLDPTGKASSQVYNKFGYGTGLYAHDTVFEASGLAPLMCEFQKLKEAGKPGVVHKQLPVVKNTWWGIAGGYSVDLVLVLNLGCQDFVDSLPSDTQAELAKGSDGDFANYPFYSTAFQNSYTNIVGLTAQQVNLLAAQGEYVVNQSADLIRSVLE